MKQIRTSFTIQSVEDIIADHSKSMEQSKGKEFYLTDYISLVGKSNESETSRQRAIECFEKIKTEGVKPSEFISAVGFTNPSGIIPLHPADSLDSVRLIISIAKARGIDHSSVSVIVAEDFVYRAVGYSCTGRE